MARNVTEEKLTNDLMWYNNYPAGTASLFDTLDALQHRVRTLLEIKKMNVKGYQFLSKQWEHHLQEQLFEYGIDSKGVTQMLFSPGIGMTQEDLNRRREDNISFHLLLLGAYRCLDKQDWCIEGEVNMLRIRFHFASDAVILQFLDEINFPYEKLTSDEKFAMKDALTECTNIPDFESTVFYRIPFDDGHMFSVEFDCFLHKGFFYVPHFKTITIIQVMYRRHLEMLFKRTKFPYDYLYHGSQLEWLLEVVDCMIKPSVKHKKLDLTLSRNKLDDLSKTSFPLCVRNMFDAMKRYHHLKYQSRQLLQLFFKGIGMPVDLCTEFFRFEFLKKMTNEEFESEYLYHIRHNYGLQGNYKNYHPPNCANVMAQTVRTGEYHGCPYKNFTQDILTLRLREIGISEIDIEDIVKETANGNPQAACSKHFEVTHNGTKVNINHPNLFYEESTKFYKKIDKEKEELQKQVDNNL